MPARSPFADIMVTRQQTEEESLRGSCHARRRGFRAHGWCQEPECYTTQVIEVVLCRQVYTADSVSHPLLTAGTTYWVVLSADNPATSEFLWNQSPTPGGVFFSQSGNAGWEIQPEETAPAFDVLGTPAITTVPEPSTFFLLLAPLFAMTGIKTWMHFARWAVTPSASDFQAHLTLTRLPTARTTTR